MPPLLTPSWRPLGLAGALLLGVHALAAPIASAASCPSVMSTAIPHTAILATQIQPAGRFTPPGSSAPTAGATGQPNPALASQASNGVVDRTRPLCPYPQVARYTGTGSIDDAANFVCRQP
jgi:hypothetical protein